uniref:Putative F-box/kelch-repeat protein SKIP6 n=1 Tax=Davidia involucrata TaxID=16924 RepID=A0A5B7BR40_DAVIN
MAMAIAMARDAVPEQEEERRIYFRVENSKFQSPGKEGLYDWYAIDDNDELLHKDKEGILEPVFERLPKCQYLSACVALGPYICVIGGVEVDKLRPPPDRNIYSDVYYIDTLCPGNGWNQAPPLIKPRAHPHAFVVDGKIYVLAAMWNSNDPWAEVFDPCQDLCLPRIDLFARRRQSLFKNWKKKKKKNMDKNCDANYQSVL